MKESEKTFKQNLLSEYKADNLPRKSKKNKYMNKLWKGMLLLVAFLGVCVASFATIKETIVIEKPNSRHSRVIYGVDVLKNNLTKAGYKVILQAGAAKAKKSQKLVKFETDFDPALRKEGYAIHIHKNVITLRGADASGLLYACLELSDFIKTNKTFPKDGTIQDTPEMVLRGQCIGLQKPYYLPGRTVYEYPYTPETFPWFYDKKLWLQVLDSMVANRMNSLYLWNGHPFASLVKLKEYPYALEVDNETFRKNEDIFKFLTTEADKRGIWVIQMFYNIIVSKPFAEKNNLKTQERERPILPIIADYTRKSIAEFVKKYPNVGFLVTLGEAMEGVGNDDIEWFTKTILPGVKDGLLAMGKKDLPPIVLRAHDADAPAVMKAALPLYNNLYTMAKFNGEALTYETPRGSWAKLHRTLSQQGNVHIANVHILANLEPFRYAAPGFIERSVAGMHDSLKANGLHLYPEASFWDWPYSADSIVGGKRLLQAERDWIWYKAWARYAWKSKRNPAEETRFWSSAMGEQFGLSAEQGKNSLKAYNLMGEIAPRILRRYGITDGNRQTATLGMLMTQLINPFRYGLFTMLYESESPEGEMLIEYADKEWNHQPHVGETPVEVNLIIKQNAENALAALKIARPYVKKQKEEFDRVYNDAEAYVALANHYVYKTNAALDVLRYKYSDDIRDLERAVPKLETSVQWYQQLANLTKNRYLYANSMQTGARKIPLSGQGRQYKTWTQVLPVFEKELSSFRFKIDSLKNIPEGLVAKVINLKNADIKFSASEQLYTIDSLSQPFTDKNFIIQSFAKELKGLQAIKTSYKDQIANGTTITFSSSKPVRVLVGFFKPQKAAFTVDTVFLKQPELETNAQANDYGQADTKIANAMIIPGMPQLLIHTYQFGIGTHRLRLEKGVALILGFIDADSQMPVYDAGLYESGNRKQVDWLFE